MGFGWQEIDKTLDLCYIRVAGLHRECKPAVLFDPPNFRPRTMTHILIHLLKEIFWESVWGLQGTEKYHFGIFCYCLRCWH